MLKETSPFSLQLVSHREMLEGLAVMSEAWKCQVDMTFTARGYRLVAGEEHTSYTHLISPFFLKKHTFFDKTKILQIYLVLLKSAFFNLNHYILYKEYNQAAPHTLHVLPAWDPPNRFWRGPGSLHRTSKYLMKLKSVLLFLLVTWSQLHLYYTEQV